MTTSPMRKRRVQKRRRPAKRIAELDRVHAETGGSSPRRQLAWAVDFITGPSLEEMPPGASFSIHQRRALTYFARQAFLVIGRKIDARLDVDEFAAARAQDQMRGLLDNWLKDQKAAVRVSGMLFAGVDNGRPYSLVDTKP